jgi:hypothetical protein
MRPDSYGVRSSESCLVHESFSVFFITADHHTSIHGNNPYTQTGSCTI